MKICSYCWLPKEEGECVLCTRGGKRGKLSTPCFELCQDLQDSLKVDISQRDLRVLICPFEYYEKGVYYCGWTEARYNKKFSIDSPCTKDKIMKCKLIEEFLLYLDLLRLKEEERLEGLLEV